jgi:hypothetical protein
MRVQRLTEAGITTFAGWLESLKAGGQLQAPTALLTDPQNSEPLAAEMEVEPRDFANRFEAGEYLYTRFSASGLTDVERDRGLWAWLSLFYFDAVCPVGKDGIRKPRALARHIPEPGNWRRYYRHLLAGPYRIYRAHRDNPQRALALLCQPLDTPGEVVEQFASRQELVTNRGIMALATRLYVETTTQQLKRRVSGKGGGSPRRLALDVVEQFELTWDLYAATVDELVAVMPQEFGEFLE